MAVLPFSRIASPLLMAPMIGIAKRGSSSPGTRRTMCGASGKAGLRRRFLSLRYLARDTQAHPERFAFVETETILEKICTQHNAKTICGAGLFPAVKELTADGFLHPNDLGHQVYAQRLAKAMRR